MKTTLTILIALAGFSIASAQSPGGGVFQKFDKNSDGKVTSEELPNAQAFERFDVNKDGAITLEEYTQVAGGMKPTTTPTTPTKPGETPPATKPATTVPADAVFSGYDKNSDGKVTTDELASPQAFARFDLDKDGAISLDEYNKVSGKTAPTTTPGTTPPPSPAVSQIDAMVKQFDVNADGKITREESAGAQWFNRVDSNADGVIDAEELAMVKKIVARGGAGGGRGMPSAAPAISPEDVKKVTSGPEILKPGDVGIGRMIGDAPFTDLGQGASFE